MIIAGAQPAYRSGVEQVSALGRFVSSQLVARLNCPGPTGQALVFSKLGFNTRFCAEDRITKQQVRKTKEHRGSILFMILVIIL
jgi:hypothetical protein